jgi:hypothetical protein
LDAEAFAADTYRGMGIMNVEVEHNVVTPYSSNPNKTYLAGATELTQEGFFPCFLFGPGAVKAPVTTVFQNVNFWNNSQSVPVTYSATFLPYTRHACVTASAPPVGNAP